MEFIEMSNSKPEILHGSYTVKAGDSLMSIAARVGTVTPAQLARFNRLGMLGATHPPLFPGQKLYIPNKDEVSAQNVRLRHLPGTATRVHCLSTGSTDLASPTGRSDPLKIGSVSSSRASTVPSTSQPSGREAVMEKLFVKIDAKRVLQPSKCQVDGVLIITPDAVCFDATATASALTRATAARRSIHPHSPANDSSRGDEIGEAGSPRVHSPAPEPVLEAADPVHDVLALSVCIPIGAVVSLNTHGDVNNLLSGCRSKAPITAPSKVDLPDPAQAADILSDKSIPTSKDEAEGVTPRGNSSEDPDQRERLHEVEEEEEGEVFISIGVDTERILSSVPPVSASDQTTLHEAASSSLHVFKIPLDKLAEIHDILVTATNLAASQVASPEQEESRKALLDRKRPPSMIESALEEMACDSIELTLVGGTSSILDEAMLKDLARGLPPSRLGNTMKLVFSTARDGFSLNTLYRKTQFIQDVNLLLIRDYLGSVFGALLSERMHCSQHFYGTGESCVFHWRNGFKCYNWTKKNYFFMQGSHNSFLIGAKSGHSAIWFDGDLKYGRSEATDTFDNPVLCSIPTASKLRIQREKNKANSLVPSPSTNSLHDTTSVAFVIDALEVWEMIA
uniref:Oxidation resistance protein 1 n=1 Tax=Mesocestoides corti TaxID=53468 RepID=A0A5K3EZ33_MESCO